MAEKIEVVKRDKFFAGMPEKDRELFDKILPFEDNTPKSEIIRRMELLPEEERSMIEEICQQHYKRKIEEVKKCDREIFKKSFPTVLKRLILAFLKTPVAKLLYALILGLLAMQFIR